MNERSALYAGSFDPVTYGHIDLIKRAVKVFDKVVVAVARNTGKKPMFSVEERQEFLRRALRDINKVEVASFSGLVVDYAVKNGIPVLIRGLRMVSDFEYEFQMAITNRTFSDKVETLFLMPSEDYFYFSSRLIKEVVALGGDGSRFVPPFVLKAMKKRLADYESQN